LKVGGVKLRVFEDHGGISKWLVVQGGPVKFPQRRKRKENKDKSKRSI
jgi:hypothetical protein